MPGIAGFVESASPVGDTCLSAMMRAMHYDPAYTATRYSAGACGMGVVTFHTEPVISVNGPRILAFWGDLIDDDGLRQRLPGDRQRGLAGADLMMAAWQDLGADALCGLNGLYIAALWDAETSKLTLVNDRYGFRKAYYWQGPDGFAFASETKAIAALPGFRPKTDPLGLTYMLAMTYPIDNHTLLDGVRLMPPGVKLTWEQGRLTIQQYASLPFGEPTEIMSDDDLFDGMAARIRSAMERSVRPHTALLLTGGLDSRSLAGGLPVNRPENMLAITAGNKKDHDVRFGRQIAETVGLPHVSTPIPETYIEDFAEAAMQRTEGLVSCHTFWNVSYDSVFQANGVEWALTGAISSAIRSCIPFNEDMGEPYASARDEEAPLRSEYHGTLRSGFKDEELAEILRPEILKETRDAPWEALRRTFYAAPTEHRLRRIDYLHMREYERRFICSGLDIPNASVRVAVPFLDQELFDFSYRTRVARPMDRKAWIEMLCRHFPNVAAVPRSAYALPLSVSWYRALVHKAYMWAYFHPLPALTGGRLGGRNYGVGVKYDAWLRGPMRGFVERKLLNDDLLGDWFDMNTLRAIVRRHMTGESNSYSKICVLLTLALWRERFQAE